MSQVRPVAIYVILLPEVMMLNFYDNFKDAMRQELNSIASQVLDDAKSKLCYFFLYRGVIGLAVLRLWILTTYNRCKLPLML